MSFTNYYFDLGYNTQLEKVAIDSKTVAKALKSRMAKEFATADRGVLGAADSIRDSLKKIVGRDKQIGAIDNPVAKSIMGKFEHPHLKPDIRSKHHIPGNQEVSNLFPGKRSRTVEGIDDRGVARAMVDMGQTHFPKSTAGGSLHTSTPAAQRSIQEAFDDSLTRWSKGKNPSHVEGEYGVIKSDPKQGVIKSDSKQGVIKSDPKQGVIKSDSKQGVIKSDSKQGVINSDSKQSRLDKFISTMHRLNK